MNWLDQVIFSCHKGRWITNFVPFPTLKLFLWRPQAHGPPVSEETRMVEEAIYDYSFFDYLPA